MIAAKESAHFYGIVLSLSAQSQKVERLQSEMKTQEQQMEDIDGAKKKITVSMQPHVNVRCIMEHNLKAFFAAIINIEASGYVSFLSDSFKDYVYFSNIEDS